MSHRKPKGKRLKVACGTCRRNLPATPAALLQQASDALNACITAGLDLKVHGRAIECEEGLILKLLDGRGFVARTRLYTEFPVPPSPDVIED